MEGRMGGWKGGGRIGVRMDIWVKGRTFGWMAGWLGGRRGERKAGSTWVSAVPEPVLPTEGQREAAGGSLWEAGL